jgi:hypothetical protein
MSPLWSYMIQNQHSYPMKEWHLENMKKTAVKYVLLVCQKMHLRFKKDSIKNRGADNQCAKEYRLCFWITLHIGSGLW